MRCYSLYHQVERLPEDQLAALLREGDATERVWAAWALGMRLSDQVGGTVQSAMSREPNPGVRRLFIIILAGAGRRDVLGALAEGDPSGAVRATALQYLARLTSPKDDTAVSFLLQRLRTEPCVEARLRLLENLPPDSCPCFRPDVVSLLTSDSLEIRCAVVDRLLAWADGRLPEELAAWIPSEPDLDLRNRLLAAWCDCEGTAPMVSRALSYPVPLSLVALDLAIERGSIFPWGELERFAKIGDVRVDLRIARLLSDDASPEAREWLLERVLANVQAPELWNEARRLLWETAQVAMVLLERAVVARSRQHLTSTEAQLVTQIREAVEEAERRSLRSWDDDDDDEDFVVCSKERLLLTALDRV